MYKRQVKEKLKEAQERQRLENENRQLKVQVEYLEEDLSWERGISAVSYTHQMCIRDRPLGQGKNNKIFSL